MAAINSGNKIKQRIGVWWKFRYPLIVASLSGLISAFFIQKDVHLSSIVESNAPPLALTIGSTVASVASPASSILDNFTGSTFGTVFWLTAIGITLGLWLMLSGIEVLFGKRFKVVG